MMIPVKIYIESVIQSEPDQEPDVIKQEVSGRFQEKENGEWVLKYEENSGTREEVKTSVKSMPEKVTIIRQGAVSYRQSYEPGKTLGSMVHTPAGITEMEVTTLTYERKLKGQEGWIDFSFLLHMGQQNLGKYQLSLRWMGGSWNESA
jgi:uncharacterized beta-barrel protein YwiB (DUF1934 family)